MTLNKYMIVAMNHENHTKEELDVNFSAASDYAANAAARAATDADNAYSAAAAAAAAYTEAELVHCRITEYFEITGEDKALYEAEIERINEANNE